MEAITVGNFKKVLELFPDEAPLMCFDMSIDEMYAAVKFGAVTCANGKMPRYRVLAENKHQRNIRRSRHQENNRRRNKMTVGKLKKLLEKFDDSAPVCIHNSESDVTYGTTGFGKWNLNDSKMPVIVFSPEVNVSEMIDEFLKK